MGSKQAWISISAPRRYMPGLIAMRVTGGVLLIAFRKFTNCCGKAVIAFFLKRVGLFMVTSGNIQFFLSCTETMNATHIKKLAGETRTHLRSILCIQCIGN